MASEGEIQDERKGPTGGWEGQCFGVAFISYDRQMWWDADCLPREEATRVLERCLETGGDFFLVETKGDGTWTWILSKDVFERMRGRGWWKDRA